ncbi:TonB-dependent receptor [Stakelama marina]|uniref:TonB-dependent receptor n=1 Tax=Stakelama marina TaxID=2826939 RepID=A0A8T4ID13_9SPHN|nr:TonB-dependent receptor [Stakelama marina]MBR0552537.1 TonB-dependent receptor [Stakelama marina]
MAPSATILSNDRRRFVQPLRCGASLLALSAVGMLVAPAAAAAHGAPPLQQATSAKDSKKQQDQQNQPAANEQSTSASDQASAAQASAQGGSEIVVTGFRESLRSAQAIKKNSDVIVDSVTAEDIGALPDRSVTETLQRIPGVTINRFAAGVDPDHFSVEGSGVVIRGLTYVGSRFNGREAFSAGNSSGLSFADVPSELLAGVDVFKTPSADMIAGGIAGIVNLRTRLPFDQKDSLVAGSLEMNYGDFINKGAPNASILGSKRWSTGIGEIGILGSFSYSQLFSRADRLGISSFRPRTTYSDGTRTDVIPFDGATAGPSILFPRGAVMGSQEFNRKRYGYSAALQWESNDGSLQATFQFLRSDARQTWGEHTIEIATDNVSANGDSRAVAGTSINYDDSGVFESGYITAPTGWRADQNGPDARTPAYGLQSNNIARNHGEKIVTSDYSANLRWTPTERLAFNFDYQHVDSSSHVDDNTLWGSSYQDAYLKLNGSNLPEVTFLPPQNCSSDDYNTATGMCTGTPGTASYPSYYTGSHQSFTDPYNSFYRSAMDHIEQSDGNEDAFRLDGELSFPESGFLKSIKAGGRYAKKDQTARFSTYNWGRLSEQWGNGGPVWFDDPIAANGGQPLQGYAPFFFNNFFNGGLANPLNGQGRLFYSGDSVANYDQYVQYANMINQEWEAQTTCADGKTINGGWNALANRCGVLPGTPFLPGEVNPQSEETWAAYGLARIDTEFANGWKLNGNVGVRYTHTHRVSKGYISFPAATNLPSDADCSDAIQQAIDQGTSLGNALCALSPQQRTDIGNFLNGAIVPNDFDVTYDYFLPSVNFKLEVGGGVQFRVGYAKGIYAPQFGYTRNYKQVAVNAVPNVDASGNQIPIVVNPDGTIDPGQVRVQGQFTAGNPALVPTKADSFDFSAEWYFSNVGHLTGALFYKRLTNIVTNSTTRETFSNNGLTYDAIVTTPVNSSDVGKIKGAEISYQQTYDFLPGFLSGLGLQATYTYVDSSGVPQTTLSATDPDVAAGRVSAIEGNNFPLQGLSKHTINITPFIDIGDLSARVSYNWRSRYLLTIRDVITPFDPIFQRAYGQLDGSITYSVNDHFKIGVQAVNLLKTKTKTEAAVLDADQNIRYVPRQWYTSDSRFTILTRFSF